MENFITQIKRSFAISKKDLRIYYNKGPVVIQGILFPIMLFLAFTVGRQIIPVYIISGLMAMVLFLTSTSIGPVVFPWETRQKTLERLITCPVSIRTILLGNVWSSFIFGCIFSTVPLLLGIVFFELWKGFNLLILIPGIILAAFSFSSFSLILSAPPTDTPASTMILTIIIKFPLIFISPLFMPIIMNPLVLISPLTYFLDTLNVGLGEQSAFGSFGLLIDFGYLLIFGFGFLILAFALHEKTLQKRFRG
ncbi:MAG: ABC transporter permease [Candidatus Thorarchaeota archaeon]